MGRRFATIESSYRFTTRLILERDVMSSSLAFIPGMSGPLELMILGGIVLLLFGNRLPGVMRSLGRSIVEFKKGAQGIEDHHNSSSEGKDEAVKNG